MNYYNEYIEIENKINNDDDYNKYPNDKNAYLLGYCKAILKECEFDYLYYKDKYQELKDNMKNIK